VATYRYWFCDALTGQILEELPLDCQSYSQQINGAGTCTGTLALGDIPAAVDWQDATLEKRTLLVVQRDDQYVWAGRIMKNRPVANSTQAEITAETLEGYLARRRIKTDLTYGSATDVFTIVRDIIAQLEGVVGGGMQLATGANLAGQTTTITYLGKDRTKALDAFNRLAEVSPGFEYTITWSRSGNVFTPTLTLAAPSLAAGLDPVVFEHPGNLLGPVDTPRDGGDAPNALTGVGADSGGTPLLYEAVDTSDELAAGYPIYEDEYQIKDEADATRLAARTTTALASKLADYVVPTVDLRGDAIPGFGDFPLGSPCRLRCTCLFHPAGTNGVPGLDITRRITGWTVTPGANEKASLALGSITGKITPPIRGRGMAGYLTDLDRRLRVLETT
jgi:hypothetical protein